RTDGVWPTIKNVGVIGVGELGEAITVGLSIAPHPPEIHLSRRSRPVSHRLTELFTNVRVARNNQEVIDRSEAIILAVPPPAVVNTLSPLQVPPDKLVISAVAGARRDDLRAHLPGGADVVRVIPLPAVRRQAGITSVFPASAPTEELFGRLGPVVVARTEDQFSALSAVTATISTHLAYLGEITNWLVHHGWENTAAEMYIRGVFAGVSDTLAASDPTLDALLDAHETAGGINQQFREDWFDAEKRASLHSSLNDVLRRVSGRA
ncbi:NAD(P)-binding domain-containing protein, partial [Tsukamurella paurometabola]